MRPLGILPGLVNGAGKRDPLQLQSMSVGSVSHNPGRLDNLTGSCREFSAAWERRAYLSSVRMAEKLVSSQPRPPKTVMGRDRFVDHRHCSLILTKCQASVQAVKAISLFLKARKLEKNVKHPKGGGVYRRR